MLCYFVLLSVPVLSSIWNCNNLCPFAYDGICQDGGNGSVSVICIYGSDCADCGVRPPYTERPSVPSTGEPTVLDPYPSGMPSYQYYQPPLTGSPSVLWKVSACAERKSRRECLYENPPCAFDRKNKSCHPRKLSGSVTRSPFSLSKCEKIKTEKKCRRSHRCRFSVQMKRCHK